MFDLVRPCTTCPFRRGQGENYQLRPGRLREIARATAFTCHKTCVYDDDGNGRPGNRPQQCAGLMAVLHRDKRPNQIMQVAERLGALDPRKLDPDGEAYPSWAEVLTAHRCTEDKRD